MREETKRLVQVEAEHKLLQEVQQELFDKHPQYRQEVAKLMVQRAAANDNEVQKALCISVAASQLGGEQSQ